MISFLKKVDEDGEEKHSKFMGKSDIIFVLAIGSLVGGFWYFSKSVKEDTYAQFTHCDSLFQAQQLRDAESCYDATLELGYRSDSLDSVSYKRREVLDGLREAETAQSRAIDSLLRVGDSLSAWNIKKSVEKVFFLEGEQLKQWEAVQAPKAVPEPPPPTP